MTVSEQAISARDPHPRKRAKLLGTEMAYVDSGRGDPIVLLHGNPTSSYLWRNVIPHLSSLGRCLAPDLIGMGDSGKSSTGSYRFVDHSKHLDAWFDAVGIREKVTLVVHDWGSALGFHWAHRNLRAIKGIAYMEAIVRPLTWSDWPGDARRMFEGLRGDSGEEMILQRNLFVETILPRSIIRKLSDEEMDVYRRPYREPGESRRPTLTWPREIPIDGEPPDVTSIVKAYSEWLAKSPVPKLLIVAEPGAILRGAQLEFCRKWPNQREVSIKGNHFIQEDSPHEIGEAIASWYKTLA